MSKKCPILFALLLCPLIVLSQVTGGQSTYMFLTMPQSARISALGGYQIALSDQDVSFGTQNPALYNPEMHQFLQVNHHLFFDGIHQGYVAYAQHFDSIATTFAAGLQYISYGKFALTDETGQENGTFSGGEYAFNLGGSRNYKSISYGANLKIIGSHLESYNSFGIALDVGGYYRHPESNFSVGLTFKNIGTQISTYYVTRENLPFDIQLGISQRLKYLPFRLSIIAHHLHRWNIRFNDPALQANNNLFNNNQSNSDKKYIVDKFFRHLVFNGEIYLGRVFMIQAGYNHLRRQEMGINAKRTLTGFSFGAGIKIKRFTFNYGKAFYHASGGNNHIGLSMNLHN
ncbi:MAG: type IX secretion system protein PorQ [Sphingobacteriales bacterium]|nr:MAG: type IX secretion system protein PorQ [Sphingobacteriales bacterium]